MEVIDQPEGDSPSPTDYPFNQDMKQWADDNFNWIHEVYGDPWGLPHDDSEDTFPNIYTAKSDNLVESAIQDFCDILEIDRQCISYEIMVKSDLVHTIGDFLNCELQIIEEGNEKTFLIGIPEELVNNPGYLMYKFSLCFSQIVLEQDNVPYYNDDLSAEDINAFLHIAAVYFSFGVILARHGEQIGTTWNYPLSITNPLLGYIIGLWSEQLEFDDEDWINELPKRVKDTYLQYKKQASSN